MTNSIWELPFMKHVQPEPNSGCWIWTNSRNNEDYAQRQQNRKKILVHRELFQLLKGPIPNGLELDHLCRIRSCVNPDHLEIVTHRENVHRGAANAGKLAPPGHRRNKARVLLKRIRSHRRQFLSRKFQSNPKQKSLL